MTGVRTIDFMMGSLQEPQVPQNIMKGNINICSQYFSCPLYINIFIYYRVLSYLLLPLSVRSTLLRAAVQGLLSSLDSCDQGRSGKISGQLSGAHGGRAPKRTKIWEPNSPTFEIWCSSHSS